MYYIVLKADLLFLHLVPSGACVRRSSLPARGRVCLIGYLSYSVAGLLLKGRQLGVPLLRAWWVAGGVYEWSKSTSRVYRLEREYSLRSKRAKKQMDWLEETVDIKNRNCPYYLVSEFGVDWSAESVLGHRTGRMFRQMLVPQRRGVIIDRSSKWKSRSSNKWPIGPKTFIYPVKGIHVWIHVCIHARIPRFNGMDYCIIVGQCYLKMLSFLGKNQQF